MSLTAAFDSLYLSLSRRAMCRESGFFPTQTKFLPSDPHRHPTSLLLPFPSFRLSAVKGNNQTPNIHHSSHSAAETEIKSKKFIWLMPLELLQAADKTQYSVLYAGKYYRTITVQLLLRWTWSYHEKDGQRWVGSRVTFQGGCGSIQGHLVPSRAHVSAVGPAHRAQEQDHTGRTAHNSLMEVGSIRCHLNRGSLFIPLGLNRPLAQMPESSWATSAPGPASGAARASSPGGKPGHHPPLLIPHFSSTTPVALAGLCVALPQSRCQPSSSLSPSRSFL